MGVIRVENQAVKLYESTETLFNDKDSSCEWHLDYNQIANCDDMAEILLNTTVVAIDLENDGTFDDNETGLATTTTVNQLRDSGASFLSTVVVGMFVRNTSNDTVATVVSVDSNIQLTLSSDIFPLVAYYSISYYEMTGGMTITGGQLVQTAGTAGTCKQYTLPTQNQLYKIQIDITSFISGTVGQQINFKIGGDVVLTLDETSVTTGTLTILGFNTNTDYTEFEITCDADLDVTFDNLSISQYSNSIFYIVDAETDLPVYYSAITDVITSTTQDQIKMTVDWANVGDGYTCDGCYYIVIMQDVDFPIAIGDDRITNGTFDSASGWTLGTGWGISGGTASVSIGSLAGDLEQSLNRSLRFSKGICYDISLTVLEYGAGAFTIQLYSGITLVAESVAISANGDYVFNTGILTDSVDTIKIHPTFGGNPDVYKLDNITAFIDLECTGYRYRTDNYKVADSHDCTVKLSGLNNDVAFGIDFISLNYNPTIRVAGELLFPNFEGEKINEEDSNGISKTLYFKSNTQRGLFLYQLPEHYHNFIRLLIGYDSFTVDDVEYLSIEGSYEGENDRVLGKLPDLSNSTTELRLKDDLNKNIFC